MRRGRFMKVLLAEVIVQVMAYTWVHLWLCARVGMELAPPPRWPFTGFAGRRPAFAAGSNTRRKKKMTVMLRKLSSRKLWAAVAGVATGIALALGTDSDTITAVTGAVTALISVVTYIITEGKVDAAGVGRLTQLTAQATQAVHNDGQSD